MKNKIIILSIIFVISLVGCNKQNTETTSESTSDMSTSTNNKEETQQDSTNISIYTKNGDIPYEKFIYEWEGNTVNQDDYLKSESDFIDKLDQNELSQLELEEEIRLDFSNNIPKEVKVEKTYIKQDRSQNYKEDVQIKNSKDNKFIDFIHSYDNSDKYLQGLIYNITVKWEEGTCIYVFGFKIDNNSTPNNKPYSVTGYLSSSEQKTYDSYKADRNIKSLLNIEPITIAKFYAQAIMEEEYDLAYSLYSENSEKPTKDEYIKIIKGLDKTIKEQYITNIKAVEKGKFLVDDENNGYIEYELVADHPMAMDMIKDSDGVWKVKYMPIQ